MSDPVHTPRQKRSERTQEKLLVSLEALLRDRFFEQVTIQDIAGAAGVAVGTVYRRFRDKEAMLPVLYQRLEVTMNRWADGVWAGASVEEMDLRRVLHRLVTAHLRFYKANAPVLRTMYLQVRLDTELADPGVAERRKALYTDLMVPVWRKIAEEGHPKPADHQARCFILLLLAPINERCLFPENTPASTLRMSDRRFADELTEALYRYLAADTGRTRGRR